MYLDYLVKKMWGLYVKNSQILSFSFETLFYLKFRVNSQMSEYLLLFYSTASKDK